MMKIFLGMICFLSLSVQAQQLNDDYYANDVLKAIKEAKHRPHHYDYSSMYRYSRTTSQSLDIPKLLSDELSSTVITDSVASDPLNPEQISTVDTTSQSGLNTDISNKGVGIKQTPTIIASQPALNTNVTSQSSVTAYSRP